MNDVIVDGVDDVDEVVVEEGVVDEGVVEEVVEEGEEEGEGVLGEVCLLWREGLWREGLRLGRGFEGLRWGREAWEAMNSVRGMSSS